MHWLVVILAFFFSSCSCNSNKRGSELRIGIDPSFAPLNFEEMQPYVNGYVEELLLEVAHFTGMRFEKIHANWDTLLEGMKRGRYDAIFSSMPDYNFNRAKYEFSESFLDLGPVLVVPANANYSDLKGLSGELVGVITGDPAVLAIEEYPEVIIRAYHKIPDLLNAVVNGDIEAAVLDLLSSRSYVRDLYAGQLKIATAPLTPIGLRAVVLKGESTQFMRLFNRALEQMKKKKKLEALQEKWNL
ncbi:MAG TPA: transporter substrate-binding domain-containing protein [Chlamydiales bacterium]|jgi:ABC-type amino acid transport substrate-binding protein|nr:transporter substrate-binding domain-containing protein [Chlamydiales bacterium]